MQEGWGRGTWGLGAWGTPLYIDVPVTGQQINSAARFYHGCCWSGSSAYRVAD
jgi:hypothetical protein